MAVIHIGCFSLLFILWNPRGTPFFYQFCDAQLSRDVVLRSPHFIFGKKREKDLKSDRNNCTSLSLGLRPCESQRAPKRFSLWGSNSFRMRIVISMTIESKDFFATQPWVVFSSGSRFLWRAGTGLSLRFLTYFVNGANNVLSFGWVRSGRWVDAGDGV